MSDLIFDDVPSCDTNVSTDPTQTSDSINDITWSNWDNLIDFIKLNLGASVNSLEFSDTEMIGIIQDHVLPEFSRYVPYIKYYILYENDAIQRYPFYVYEFTYNTHKILRVNSLIKKPNLLDLSQYYNMQQTSGDVTDYLLSMNVVQMASDIVAPDTWKFKAPNRLELITGATNYGISKDFVVELECVHKDPSTIDPDQYRLLKNLALSEIMIYLGRIRTKFQTFNTPQAQVDILAGEMLQEGQQLKEKTLQDLDDLPPDHMIWFLN